MSKVVKGTEDYSKEVGRLLKELEKNYEVKVGGPEKVEAATTGILSLDLVTGIGGFPRGRISVLAGWESSGKSTTMLKAIAAAQARGEKAAYVDTEWAFDPEWAASLGVDVDDLILIQSDNLEDAGEVTVELASSGLFDFIGLDSIAGAPIKAVVDGDLGDANMGRRAKIMSDFMPKLNGPVARNNIVMVIVNQLRQSLNRYSPRPVMPGGKALMYHSSLTIHLHAKRPTNAVPVSVTSAFTEKNKLSTPFKEIEYTVDSNGFVDEAMEAAEILTSAQYASLLGTESAGAWYTLPSYLGLENPKIQGKNGVARALGEDLDVLAKAQEYIRKVILEGYVVEEQ